MERPTVQNSKLILCARNMNKCILSRYSLNTAILLNKMPAEKLHDYDRYPLAHRLGFIPLIVENEFDIASATILDVGFLGLFPKCILQCLYNYAREVAKTKHDKGNFMPLVNDLITAFVFRPVVIQKVIQIMLSKQKNAVINGGLAENLPGNTSDDPTEYASCNGNITHLATPVPASNTSTHATTQPFCYGNKCRLLRAKGILRRPMRCVCKKNMCSGCINESLRHKRVLQIENEILTNVSPNESWMPLLKWIYTPITLAKLRHLLQHISVFKIKKRDDHLYGATRYLANSLGIYICDTNMSDLVDQPMTPVGKKQVWCLATFHCRCINKVNLHTFQARTFARHAHFWYRRITCLLLMKYAHFVI
jgi:hypothetical protein